MFDRCEKALRTARVLAGKAVTYVRSSQQIPVKAIRGKSTFQRTDQYGAVLTFDTVDWILESDDLVGWTPEAGDKIEHVTERWTRTFEVTCPTETEPAFREIGDRWLRIHTQKTADE